MPAEIQMAEGDKRAVKTRREAAQRAWDTFQIKAKAEALIKLIQQEIRLRTKVDQSFQADRSDGLGNAGYRQATSNLQAEGGSSPGTGTDLKCRASYALL